MKMYKAFTILLAVFAIIIFAYASNAYSQTCPGSPGCLDPTFGSGGINALIPPLADDPTWDGAQDMVFQNDGKIVILAKARNTAATFRNVLIRLTADGQLDATFASGGLLYIPSTGPLGYYVRRLIKQTIGGQERFVLAGGDKCGTANCLKIEAFKTDGTLDPSFGTGGATTMPTGCIPVNAVALQSDQKMIFGCPQAPLIRLNANGSPDSSFGPNGIARTNDPAMMASDITIQSDGKIVTAGTYLTNASQPDFYVARFTSTGSSDTTFGTKGKWVKNFDGFDDSATGLAVDSSGRIVAVGHANINGPMSSHDGWNGVIVRLTSKGAVDTTFGSNGIAATFDVGGGEDQFRSAAIQPDGKIVVTGRGTLAGNLPDILTARYNSNGTLDTTFNGVGWKLTDVYGGGDVGTTGFIQFDQTCSCSKLVVSATAPSGPAPSPIYIAGIRFSL